MQRHTKIWYGNIQPRKTNEWNEKAIKMNTQAQIEKKQPKKWQNTKIYTSHIESARRRQAENISVDLPSSFLFAMYNKSKEK